MSMTGFAGPDMSVVDANAFMYALHYKIESIEKWALTVNESITDHAERIDVTRARAAHSFNLFTDEILTGSALQPPLESRALDR